MGDLLGSPRVAPLFLGLVGYHSDLPLVVPMGSALPIAIGARRSSTQSHDRKIRAVEIVRLGSFPVFCRAWKIPSFLDDRRKRQAFWTVEAKLWVETLGGGDGSRRGSVRTCFLRQ